MEKKPPRQFIYQSVMEEVPPGEEVSANAHPKYPGVIKHVIFHSGVVDRFVVLAFGVNFLNPSGPTHPVDLQDVDEEVEAHDTVMLVAQNVSEKPALFCYQIIMEVEDAVWQLEKDGRDV